MSLAQSRPTGHQQLCLSEVKATAHEVRDRLKLVFASCRCRQILVASRPVQTHFYAPLHFHVSE